MTPQAKRLTPEELLQPRYEVIADYPEIERHNIRIGDIITINESAMYADKTQDGTPVVAIDHEIFPAIFRRLDWWEYRTPEEMPEYVKKTYGKFEVVKVVRYHQIQKNIFFQIIDGNEEYEQLAYWEPATLQDYTQYINSLK